MERVGLIMCHSISMNGFHGKVIIIIFTVNLQGTAFSLSVIVEAVGNSTTSLRLYLN